MCKEPFVTVSTYMITVPPLVRRGLKHEKWSLGYLVIGLIVSSVMNIKGKELVYMRCNVSAIHS